MQSTQLFIEGLSPNGISYRLYGQNNPGVPLILVMGYGGCMFAWPLEFVSKLAENFKIIIFDNRGTGRSAPLANNGAELRMHHFAEDLKNLIEHLGFSCANLFGYSMGGCIALEFANLYPKLANKLILQSTTAGGALYTGSDSDVKDRLANPRGRNFDEMLFDFFDLCMGATAMQKHMAILSMICDNARPFPTPPRVLQPQLKAFRNFDASVFVKEIKQPVLLFHGKQDRVLKVQNGEKLSANLPNCHSEFLDDCGHCPHIEYENLVVKRILEFSAASRRDLSN